RYPLRPSVGYAVFPGGATALPRDAGGPAGGDPVPWHDARGRGGPGPFRQAGRVPERTEGVWAGRPPVPSLPDADQGRQDIGAERVLLPAVPVVVAGTVIRAARRRRACVRARVARPHCEDRPRGSRT